MKRERKAMPARQAEAALSEQVTGDRCDEEAALRVLQSAKIERSDSFDGPAMMRELHCIERRHDLRTVAASNVDHELLGRIASAAKRLSTRLNEAERKPAPHGAPDEADRMSVTWIAVEIALGTDALAHLRCALDQLEKGLSQRLAEPSQLPAFGYPNGGAIIDLSELYERVTGRKPSVTIDPRSKKPRPAVRFIVACFAKLGVTITPGAVVQAHKRRARRAKRSGSGTV